MSLNFNGTDIPRSANITYNGTTLTKIIFNGVEVWTKGTQASWQENTYSRSTSWTETKSSIHDFGSQKELISVYMKCVHHNDCDTTRYRVYGSNNKSNWTQLTEWNTKGGNTTKTISGSYRYVKLEQYKANWHNTSYADSWVYSCEPWKVTYWN